MTAEHEEDEDQTICLRLWTSVCPKGLMFLQAAAIPILVFCGIYRAAEVGGKHWFPYIADCLMRTIFPIPMFVAGNLLLFIVSLCAGYCRRRLFLYLIASVLLTGCNWAIYLFFFFD